MLGWNIGVFRQAEGRALPGSATSKLGERLAVWQTGVHGLDWILALVAAGKAIDLGGNGYPMRYTARASSLVPTIRDGPPLAKASWGTDLHDVVTDQWEGRTVLNDYVIHSCASDEWLMVEAWDES